MTIEAGQRVPSVPVKLIDTNGVSDAESDAVLGTGLVVFFTVPGAFTPTCSKKHLPGYVKEADALKAKGVDLIACMSVNDAFVMDAWGAASGAAGKVLMLADGNGDVTRQIGLESDFSKHGMGQRARRFSMILQDGVVKELNVEAPGEFKVSSAEATACQL